MLRTNSDYSHVKFFSKNSFFIRESTSKNEFLVKNVLKHYCVLVRNLPFSDQNSQLFLPDLNGTRSPKMRSMHMSIRSDFCKLKLILIAVDFMKLSNLLFDSFSNYPFCLRISKGIYMVPFYCRGFIFCPHFII